jgi:hypothetical protein
MLQNSYEILLNEQFSQQSCYMQNSSAIFPYIMGVLKFSMTLNNRPKSQSFVVYFPIFGSWIVKNRQQRRRRRKRKLFEEDLHLYRGGVKSNQ